MISIDGAFPFQELIQDLQSAKRQTWEEKERLSEHYDEERRANLANKVRDLESEGKGRSRH